MANPKKGTSQARNEFIWGWAFILPTMLGLIILKDENGEYVARGNRNIKINGENFTFEGADALDASLLTDPSEQALLRLLSAFPAEIAAAAEKYDPARITRYVIDIATAFHRFYNACRILEADPAVRQCRMALCLAVRSVIRNVLTMFKVTVPESM